MDTFHMTLMDLTVSSTGAVITEDGQLFDRVTYSRFKYGWVPPAVEYAQGMTRLLSESLWQEEPDRPILIISAPYKFLPTASHVIAQELCAALMYFAQAHGHKPPELVQFHKSQVGDSSYAKASEAERLATLAQLGLHLDESLIPGSKLVVVDDIRITGVAEKVTAAYVETLNPHSIWYVHAARLSEDVARTNPGLEDALNQSVAHTPEEILGQYAAGEFQLNTRVLRHILEMEKDSDFDRFIRSAPLPLLAQMQEAAFGTGDAYCRKHADSLSLLAHEVAQRATPSHSLV